MFKKVFMACFLTIAALSAAGDAFAINRKAEVAEKLYLRGDYASAGYESERLFRKYNDAGFKIEVAYLAALSYLKQDEFTKSKKYFEYILIHSDDDFLTNEAQTGLDYISRKTEKAEEPDHYSIQMGSFRSRRNAVRLFNKFKRRKYTVRIVEEKEGTVTIYKVKVGKFKTKRSAVKFAKKLRKIGYETAIAAY